MSTSPTRRSSRRGAPTPDGETMDDGGGIARDARAAASRANVKVRFDFGNLLRI
jgi:hypothetical protein